MGFYAYLWLREDGTPYYAGKGSSSRAFSKKNHRVFPPRDRSRIVVMHRSSEQEAFETEKELIANWGRKDTNTGCLRNMSDGGEGPSGCQVNVRSGHLQSISSAGGKASGAIVGARNRDTGRMREVQKLGLGKGGKIGGPKGMHVRWHINRGSVSNSCKFCSVN